MTDTTTWTTNHEINHIKQMGSFAPAGYPARNRERCLRGYIAAAERREKWGDLDRDQCIGFARECLRQVQSWPN